MVAGRPYYPRYHADFIMGVRGFDLETVGAYSLIIDHLNERDRPLPDDDRFMAAILHCSPQRWRKIRAVLIGAAKIIITPDGYITNPRFERDRAKARGEHEASVAFGRAGGLERARKAGQLDMDLDAGWDDEPPRARARTEPEGKSKETAGTSRELQQKNRNSSATSSGDAGQKPSEIKGRAQPPPQAPRAREESRDQSQSLSSYPNRTARTPRKLDGADLETICEAVCEAAGLRPSTGEQRDRALAHCREWERQGVSFDQIVIPTIRAMIAKAREPTRTLGRFKVEIAHEHARSLARSDQYSPPSTQALPDPHPQRTAPLRERLRRELGARTYDGWLRPVSLDLDGKALLVTCPSPFMADWVRGHFEGALRSAGGVESVEIRTV
jgi:uncharacterized protein YdaU (DUF1376 family)